MNKEELLQELSGKVASGEISRSEVIARIGADGQVVQTGSQKESSVFSVTKVLYALGAVIIAVGVIFFASQIWWDIGAVGRVGITLGFGILMTALGSLLVNQGKTLMVGQVFHLIGGLLIPGGALVLISELNISDLSTWTFTTTFGIIFLFYLLLTIAQKHAILTFFAIANGTAFIYLLVGSIIDGAFYRDTDIFVYLTMVVGASYLLLAQGFKQSWNDRLEGPLNFFGSSWFLAACFYKIFDDPLWQMLFFFIVLGGLYLSVQVKSRSILALSTIFLIAHLTYITSEYFADSVGWPLALIVLGFVFIGLGYGSITISKRYISGTSS